MYGKTEITVTGHLGADPELRATKAGEPFAALRLGSTPRVFMRQDQVWVDGPTSWYQVYAYGGLATNVLNSLTKGDPVLVCGTLVIREYRTEDGQPRTSAQITAEVIAPNLRFGRSEFSKVSRPVLDAAADAGQPDEQDPQSEAEPTAEDSEQARPPYTVATPAG
ncbi:single-stranded DNA-binding protein [Dermacoccaceae bacterium W4C1]